MGSFKQEMNHFDSLSLHSLPYTQTLLQTLICTLVHSQAACTDWFGVCDTALVKHFYVFSLFIHKRPSSCYCLLWHEFQHVHGASACSSEGQWKAQPQFLSNHPFTPPNSNSNSVSCVVQFHTSRELTQTSQIKTNQFTLAVHNSEYSTNVTVKKRTSSFL